ncbi:MAG: SAM-dependent methyltransferase [Deltaproteobacteria bacterium]|nr:SAM-dependent methyltransferase [Deltaproteobacteria bacterium]MBI5810451.1 SAM-dependent methyltransferase [Deltaproteobacteria bacterium]
MTVPEREILRRIGEKGPITFAEFMDVALFWKDGGYYTCARTMWGERGDYITAIDMSPAFSKVIAGTIHEMWESLLRPDTFELVEVGAGRGWLSKGIDGTLKETAPELHKALRIRLVEKNPFLREAPDGRVTWHGDISELDEIPAGCIISNELIDSFPVHRVVGRRGLREFYVGFDGEGFFDIEGEPSDGGLQAYLDRVGASLSEGQKAEINLMAPEWIGSAGRLLASGFVITIDYGLPARELYAPERMEGTLLCHYRHTINGNPYVNIGSQDITAHVDFTGLAQAGAAAGLDVTGFTTQKNFLLGQGILAEMSAADGYDLGNFERIRKNREITRLIAPGGAGDAFKVLIQHKGAGEKPSLRCFSFRDMSSFL